jgi:hypothetical protein
MPAKNLQVSPSVKKEGKSVLHRRRPHLLLHHKRVSKINF